MKANMGSVDKVVRILAAVVIVALYFGNMISGTVAIILLVFAGIFIATSMISFCPLYFPLASPHVRRRQSRINLCHVTKVAVHGSAPLYFVPEISNTPMIIHQFEDKNLAHYSYAIVSKGQMAVVDPARDPSRTMTLPEARRRRSSL